MPNAWRLIFLGILLFSLPTSAQLGAVGGEWRAYGGDNGGTKYSPLDQINKENVKDLEFAWNWSTVDVNIHEANPDLRRLAAATYFECTPLMIGNVLYGTTSLGQAMAIDAFTGETIWAFDSESYKDGRPPNLGWISLVNGPQAFLELAQLPEPTRACRTQVRRARQSGRYGGFTSAPGPQGPDSERQL